MKEFNREDIAKYINLHSDKVLVKCNKIYKDIITVNIMLAALVLLLGRSGVFEIIFACCIQLAMILWFYGKVYKNLLEVRIEYFLAIALQMTYLVAMSFLGGWKAFDQFYENKWMIFIFLIILYSVTVYISYLLGLHHIKNIAGIKSKDKGASTVLCATMGVLGMGFVRWLNPQNQETVYLILGICSVVFGLLILVGNFTYLFKYYLYKKYDITNEEIHIPLEQFEPKGKKRVSK